MVNIHPFTKTSLVGHIVFCSVPVTYYVSSSDLKDVFISIMIVEFTDRVCILYDISPL